MSTQIQLTNEELLEKLEGSALDFNQKQSIGPMIESMNNDQKNELLDLIKKSNTLNQERGDFRQNYQEGLAKLNEKYTEQIEELSKKSSQEARKSFEELSQKEEGSDLEELEQEIDQA